MTVRREKTTGSNRLRKGALCRSKLGVEGKQMTEKAMNRIRMINKQDKSLPMEGLGRRLITSSRGK